LVISVTYLKLTPLFLPFNLSFFIISTPIITDGPVESIHASIAVSALDVKSKTALVASSVP
jgi:hypothetical protein